MSAVHRGLCAVAAALTLLAPTRVAAQWRPLPGTTTAPTFTPALPTDVAPTSSSDRAMLDETAPSFAAPALPGQEPRTSRDAALMIVGGAAFLLGAVIGDDAGGVLMVGGAVVALVGLYQFLR